MTPQKTIAIFTFKCQGFKPWDPDSIQSGITGAEEAVIYISKELAELGFRVFVFGDPPPHSPYSHPDANPRYLNLEERPHFRDKFDIAISWRRPALSQPLRSIAKKVYLWPHDSLDIPATLAQIQGFDDILWLSKWQRHQWNSVIPGCAKFTKIFGNGINPAQFEPIIERTNPYSCIYSSSWDRGLEILLNIWPRIKQQQPRATLDIYYGHKLFSLCHPKKASIMLEQIDHLPDVREHGLVGHGTLNAAFAKASFWLFPLIGTETFCITALRAQLAGAIPVVRKAAGLVKTVRYGYACENLKDYSAILLDALQNAETISIEDRKKMGEFVLQEFTWKIIATKWKELFESNY